MSHVFRGEIEQQQGLGGKPALHLDVRPDQVPAACALVRFVYTGASVEPSKRQLACGSYGPACMLPITAVCIDAGAY